MLSYQALMVKLLKMSLAKKILNKIGEFLMGNIMFDSEAGSEAYLIFHHGNLKDYLLKVLNHCNIW